MSTGHLHHHTHPMGSVLYTIEMPFSLEEGNAAVQQLFKGIQLFLY
jgi:hypothetical protein